MTESVGIVIVMVVVGALGILAVVQYGAQRRALASGRILGRYLPRLQNGQFVFGETLEIRTSGKWCRLLLALNSAETYRAENSISTLFAPDALQVGTPFELVLRDARGHVVHSEARSLAPFVAWLGSRQQGASTPFGETSSGNHQGQVTLLEFRPAMAGAYTLSLCIGARAQANLPGSASTWEVLEASLTVVEGVIPLSRTVSYPHRRVRF
jgi:hypothetical protein